MEKSLKYAIEKPFVIWFTGLPCSGKTTLAKALEDWFLERGVERLEHLDGDVVRSVFPRTGFSADERNRHVRQMGFLASLLEKHGVGVIASFVSPYKESRKFNRTLCKNLVEVYLSTSLAECERRDVKGHYAKARQGEITQFTGVDDPYEQPEAPELSLDTANASIGECVERIVDYLKGNEFLRAVD